MLISFSIGNFRSFRDKVTINLVASALKSQSDDLDKNNVVRLNKNLNLLKVVGVFGANASGKSNLVMALDFMSKFVANSSKESQTTEPINLEPFGLNTTHKELPSYFEATFIADGGKFRYGFEATRSEIVAEWLYYVPNIREAPLFTRKGSEIKVSGKFKEGRGLASKTRPNALFLSVAAQFNGEISSRVVRWFTQRIFCVNGVNDRGVRRFTLNLMSTEDELKKKLVSFITKLDVGLNDINLHSAPADSRTARQLLEQYKNEVQEDELSSIVDFWGKRFVINGVHNVYDTDNRVVGTTELNFETNESEGSQKLFYLLGPILVALTFGAVMFVDELDARLHPLISQKIVGFFNSTSTNPLHAQLVFTSHETNLLNSTIMRRDQIWFSEKNRQGATELSSLADFKVRKDSNFERDYILGKFGGIPYLGSFWG